MIAYSKFFKSYIKLDEYVNDYNWSFWLCDENGLIKQRYSRKAGSSFKEFKWEKLNKK